MMTDQIMNTSTSVAGWTCDKCGEFVLSNLVHVCPKWDGGVTMTIDSTILTTGWKTIIYGEGVRMLAKIDNIGNVTYADDLTLEEAKLAIKFALTELIKNGETK